MLQSSNYGGGGKKCSSSASKLFTAAFLSAVILFQASLVSTWLTYGDPCDAEITQKELAKAADGEWLYFVDKSVKICSPVRELMCDNSTGKCECYREEEVWDEGAQFVHNFPEEYRDDPNLTKPTGMCKVRLGRICGGDHLCASGLECEKEVVTVGEVQNFGTCVSKNETQQNAPA